jgi:hypothetical protein
MTSLNNAATECFSTKETDFICKTKEKLNNKTSKDNYTDSEIWFWSRLGFLPDPHGFNMTKNTSAEIKRFCGYHHKMSDGGIAVHSSILPSGWIGNDEYDYTETNRILDALFEECPEIYYVPRVKLNPPLAWQKENPGELCVYYGGPQNAEDIAPLVGTLKHDILGYDSPEGQAGGKDKRPNVGGLISNQSFASQKWRMDAEKALVNLIKNIKNSKHADRVIGYHIGYGVSAECVIWGSWDGKFADYGPAARKAFFEWGLKKYGSKSSMSEKWMQADISVENIELPSPEARKGNSKKLSDLFRGRPEHQIVIDYEQFLSDMNVDALIYLGEVVKRNAGRQTITGSFYGYITGANACNSGHLALERLLKSDAIDFLAAPNTYLYRAPGEPGGSNTAEKSMSLNGKVWINECDIRTHLAEKNFFSSMGRANNQKETDAVMWRDFARSMACDARIWWMDLMGGWFDSEEIMETVSRIHKLAHSSSIAGGKQVSEAAVVLDENSYFYMANKPESIKPFIVDTLRNIRQSGIPFDIIRLRDIINGKAPQYKLIVFPATPIITRQERKIIHNYLQGNSALWLYSSGICAPQYDLDNISLNTGVEVYDSENTKLLKIDYRLLDNGIIKNELEWSLPVLNIRPKEDMQIWSTYENNTPSMIQKEYCGFTSFYSAVAPLPSTIIRHVAKTSGCHIYIDADCSIDTTSKFICIHSPTDLDTELNLPDAKDVFSEIDNQQWNNTARVPLKMKARSSQFLLLK